jgi:1,4-dihydroxy-2-naphthoate polyprenyltransferase
VSDTGAAGTRSTPTPVQWWAGARPRTLPAAVSPVLVGTGAAAMLGGLRPLRALLALLVALALQVGVNYANDYSDGIRGTDADRVGPLRLTGSGLATPAAVRTAAFVAFGGAALAGLALVALCGSWWLLAVGAAAVLAAWFYTGGPRPYGYAGLGEVFVFVFFGLVAVLGTTYTQTGRLDGVTVDAAVAVGALACAILVTNNLRDRPGDALAGKRTLAVRFGDAATRRCYVLLLATPFVAVAAMAWHRHGALLALPALALAIPPARAVLAGAAGPQLITTLQPTGLLQLAYSALLGLGLALF